jgi:hypothetical protein
MDILVSLALDKKKRDRKPLDKISKHVKILAYHKQTDYDENE